MPDPVPREGIDEVIKTMESGKLFRYNVASKEESQVSLVEKEFSDFTGHKFAVGLNSCGSAIFLMLKCAGAQHGDKVLTNGFTSTENGPAAPLSTEELAHSGRAAERWV